MTISTNKRRPPNYSLYLTRHHLSLDLSIHGIDPDTSYPLDWDNIAYLIKDLANWRCEHCQIPHSPTAGRTLTTHHLDKDKTNSRYTNLVALCQKCHLYLHQVPMDLDTLWTRTDFIPMWVKRRGLAASSIRLAPARDLLNIPLPAYHPDNARS